MILLAISGFITTATRAQDEADVYNEAYARAHIAYTDFMRLGVTTSTYAKCLKAKNYLEPGKVPGILTINGEEFRDDGMLYDQKADDGILTSVKLSNYEKGSAIAVIGAYQMSARNNFLCDEQFSHGNEEPEMFGFKIKCKFVWVSCYTWPIEARNLCLQISWPFNGYFTATECEIEVSI